MMCQEWKYSVRFLAALLSLLPLAGFAQDRGEGELNSSEPQGITSQQIIERFAAKEKEFKRAREQYTYRQSVKVETLDGDTVTGEYQMVEDILFDDKGRRIQQVAFAPQSTLENGGISMSREDLDDFEHRLPFVLTSDELGDYSILYVGQQRQDELQTYVFDIAPKTMEKGKRYFQGRIWVDSQDFQIVKTKGKTVPDIRPKKRGDENLFPAFTTWRQQVDGVYWFPTFTRADDVLHFANRDVHIRETIKYANYKRFGSKVKITYEGQEVNKAEPEGQKPPGKP